MYLTHQHVVSVHLHQRRLLWTLKRNASPLYNVCKHVPWHLALPHELPDHCGGQIGVVQQPPGLKLCGGDGTRESVRLEQRMVVAETIYDRTAMQRIRQRSEKEDEGEGAGESNTHLSLFSFSQKAREK